ncbi:hypothetical protein LZ017_11510 [Pelomonas sp. CA6]|uniref:hypothetical protein n=1 Tax=Pelomonas sp. CA6 TaxID=2907999 RepID=UPI001F4C118C|nr:hypothetical protein [Pelomonas sp. CA6]MCH7344007.1 hypothetical protein [Pelomonas sp. CA6]
MSATTESHDPLALELEQPLQEVESCLNLLGEALHRRDSQAIELHAASLHLALARAIERFSAAARAGTVPAGLRNRLMQAGGRVAAQRESLARATAALDRAIDVLMPGDTSSGLYSAQGKNDRKSALGGSIQA